MRICRNSGRLWKNVFPESYHKNQIPFPNRFEMIGAHAVFGSPEEAYKQAIARDGSVVVAGFEPLPPLRARGFVPVALPDHARRSTPRILSGSRLVQNPWEGA